MSEQKQQKMSGEQDTHVSNAGAARRRFLRTAGATVVAIPVMQTLAGRDMMVVSAQAQTAPLQGFGGPMAGPIFDAG
jgi:hypothetical protein